MDKEHKIRLALADVARLKNGWRPSEGDLGNCAYIDTWKRAPIAEGLFALEGYVQGHETLPDGDYIHTSAVVWISEKESLARTVSRFYRLGQPMADMLATAGLKLIE